MPVKNIADPVHVFRVNLGPPRGEKGEGVASTATFRRPAVAVLPFQNMSGDPEQDYFADGLTEDIITALSMWRSFPVIARVSSFAYKGHSQDIRKVGAELGARYVVEGSVRRAGDKVRVNAQLVNAGSGHQIWSERYDRDLHGIFELQDEIAGKVAAVVAPELVRAESERLTAVRPENMDAWDACQRGKFLMNDMSTSSLLAAREFFERATELAPNFVDAWCGMAHTYHREFTMGISTNSSYTARKMLDAARRAVALDDTNAAAHSLLCLAFVNNGRLIEAVGEGERAVELNGIDPNSHDRLGAALTLAGRPDEAVRHLTASIRLHPRHPRVQIYYALLARAYLDAHQYEAAADHARRAIQRGRTFFDEHLVLASALGHLGRATEARAALKELGLHQGLRLSRIDLSPWSQRYADPGPNKHLLEGLRKAGLPE
jgi:adenylate cyclase